MRHLILSLALLHALPAHAGDLVAKDGRDEIHLHETPCESEVVAKTVPTRYMSGLNAMTAEVGDEKFAGCWRNVGNAVFMIYDDGDQGLAPLSKFRAPMDT